MNFPTKRHWRSPSQMAWITEGLHDLRRFLIDNDVKSVAVPPVGAGNDGLEWPEIREQIVEALSDLDVDVLVLAFLQTYLQTEAKEYAQALERTAELIDGFESPFGMGLLATVDWLLSQDRISPTVPAVREALKHWDGGAGAATRKSKLFDDQALGIALKRLTSSSFRPEVATC